MFARIVHPLAHLALSAITLLARSTFGLTLAHHLRSLPLVPGLPLQLPGPPGSLSGPTPLAPARLPQSLFRLRHRLSLPAQRSWASLLLGPTLFTLAVAQSLVLPHLQSLLLLHLRWHPHSLSSVRALLPPHSLSSLRHLLHQLSRVWSPLSTTTFALGLPHSLSSLRHLLHQHSRVWSLLSTATSAPGPPHSFNSLRRLLHQLSGVWSPFG